MECPHPYPFFKFTNIQFVCLRGGVKKLLFLLSVKGGGGGLSYNMFDNSNYKDPSWPKVSFFVLKFDTVMILFLESVH